MEGNPKARLKLFLIDYSTFIEVGFVIPKKKRTDIISCKCGLTTVAQPRIPSRSWLLLQ